MARVTNPLLIGMSGTIGNLVYKTNKNGETFVSRKRAPSKKKPGPGQRQMNTRFTNATKFAKAANADPALRALYDKSCTCGQSPYNMALQDALNGPEVLEIDASSYEGHVNNEIRITAVDNFRVENISVTIYSPKGDIIETGNAIPGTFGPAWIYTATRRIRTIEDCTIKAVATDLPGNEDVLISKL